MSTPYWSQHPDGIEQFSAELVEKERYYTEVDPSNITMGIFARATQEALARSPEFQNLTGEFFADRQARDGAAPSYNYAYNLLLRSFQHDALGHDTKYPNTYEDPEAFLRLFDAVLKNPLRRNAVAGILAEREVQSNIAERAKLIKLGALMLRDRIGKRPSVLDVGCSTKHGDLMLAFAGTRHFENLQFAPLEIGSITPDGFDTDERLTTLSTLALSRMVKFGNIAGIDITDIDQPAIRDWVRSCSFYPDELRDPSILERFDLLDHMDTHHKRVKFVQADFSDGHDVARVRRTLRRRFDLAVFSASLYLNNRQRQHAMLQNVGNFLSPEGLVMIIDAPDGNFAKRGNFLLQIIDPDNYGDKRHTILRVENGRCHRAEPGPDPMMINDEEVLFSEALERVV